MTTYVLIPGAGGSAWYWSRLVPELERRGHEALAVDLPAGDESAGLAEYTETVVAAVGDRRQVVVVGQSLGGLTAPLVCERVDAVRLVLLNAMVPRPGEAPGEVWANTGLREARARYAASNGRQLSDEFDPMDEFFHDVPAEVVAEAMSLGEPAQADTPFLKPWPLARWPSIPTFFIQGRQDRFSPLEYQRRVVADRLGIEIDEIPGDIWRH